MPINLTSIAEIFRHRGPTPKDKCRAMISGLRAALGMGPVLLYTRDWRPPVNPQGGIPYRLAVMDGVSCTAPMYGLITNARWATLTESKCGKAREWVEHTQGEAGEPSRFQYREGVLGYYKAKLGQPSDPDGIFIGNFSEKDKLNNGEIENAIQYVLALVEALLPELLTPTAEERERNLERMHTIERLTARIVPTMTTPGQTRVDDLLAEILLSAHSALNRTGVWGSIHRRTRRRMPGGRNPVWVLEHVAHCGVPDPLLVKGAHGKKVIEEPVRISPQRPCKQCVIAWVAHDVTPIFIRNIEHDEYANPRFNLKDMHRPVWQRACCEIAVPIRDPDDEETVYGVLNFEARDQGALSCEDVYYLEFFAAQAAVPLKSARHTRMVDCMIEASVSGDKNRALEALRNTLWADGVNAWCDERRLGVTSKAKGQTFWSVGKAIEAESLRIPECRCGPRQDGWTARIIKESATQPTGFLLRIAGHPAERGTVGVERQALWREFPGSQKGGLTTHQLLVESIKCSAEDALRREPHREHMDTELLIPASPAAIEGGAKTVLGVPLMAGKLKPVGALWIEWREAMKVSNQDIIWLFWFGAQFGQMLSHSQLERERWATGPLHEFKDYTLGAARDLAERGNLPGLVLPFDYLTAVVDCFQPRDKLWPAKASIENRAENDLRRLIFEAMCSATGDFKAIPKSGKYRPKARFFRSRVSDVKGLVLESEDWKRFLSVAVVNLLLNARRHGTGKIEIAARIVRDGGADRLVIQVTNRPRPDEPKKSVIELLHDMDKPGGLHFAEHIVRHLLGGTLEPRMCTPRSRHAGPRVSFEIRVPISFDAVKECHHARSGSGS